MHRSHIGVGRTGVACDAPFGNGDVKRQEWRHDAPLDDAENGAADSPLDPALMDELRELLARLCDDQLTESDRPRLNRILDSHEAARRYYLKYVAIHSSLAAMAGSASAADAQLAVERNTLARFAGRSEALLPACDVVSLRDEHVERWQAVLRWAAGISAVLLAAIAVWWLAPRDSGPLAPVNLVQVGNEASFELQESTDAASPVNQPLVAEVTYVSNAAVWQNPNGSFTLASRVRAGQNLTLERGQVELTYGTGAKLLLTGPSEFLVRPTGGKLRRGELVARVPEAGHGFTIETPHGKVIDLGTEFGVVVDDFGVSQVSVFEGKVETLPTRSAGAVQDKIELTSGRAIQWTENSIIPIRVQGRRYERSENDTASGDPVPATSQALVDTDFRGEPLALGSWKTLGDVVSSERRRAVARRHRPAAVSDDGSAIGPGRGGDHRRLRSAHRERSRRGKRLGGHSHAERRFAKQARHAVARHARAERPLPVVGGFALRRGLARSGYKV